MGNLTISLGLQRKSSKCKLSCYLVMFSKRRMCERVIVLICENASVRSAVAHVRWCGHQQIKTNRKSKVLWSSGRVRFGVVGWEIQGGCKNGGQRWANVVKAARPPPPPQPAGESRFSRGWPLQITATWCKHSIYKTTDLYVFGNNLNGSLRGLHHVICFVCAITGHLFKFYDSLIFFHLRA